MKKSILFVIRGKLGDSVLAFAALQAYVRQYPDDEVVLLTRTAYVPLFAADHAGKLIGFNRRIAMLLQLLWLRMRGKSFDVLAILWGFGPPIRWIARWVKAKRKIYLNDRFSQCYPEWPASDPIETLVDPAWRVVKLFAPQTARPQYLALPGLARLRNQTQAFAVGVVPVADEARKCLDLTSLHKLLLQIQQNRPGQAVWVLLNRRDVGALPFLNTQWPEGVVVKYFSDMTGMLDLLKQLSEWIGVDTGLYHVAVAMGIPATLFFGPTQPEKIVLPAQPQVASYRLAALGNRHCENKTCQRPVCLHQAAAAFCGQSVIVDRATLISDCLLEEMSNESLQALKKYPDSIN